MNHGWPDSQTGIVGWACGIVLQHLFFFFLVIVPSFCWLTCGFGCSHTHTHKHICIHTHLPLLSKRVPHESSAHPSLCVGGVLLASRDSRVSAVPWPPTAKTCVFGFSAWRQVGKVQGSNFGSCTCYRLQDPMFDPWTLGLAHTTGWEHFQR